MKRPLLMVTLTVLIIGLGLIGAFAMIAGRPAVETRAPIAVPPLIRALEVQPETLELTVKTQGTVAPRTSTSLVPEVSGRVVRVAPSFAAGGFFKPGDILVEIESHDYEWAVTRARASVAQAELRLAQEEAAAAVARREWEQIGEGDGTPLALRDLQVSEARAALEAARAVLEQARRDLDRTKIRAPFPGRVLEKSVDVGQYVTRGTSLARVYSVDVAEVRLPIPDDQLAYVQLPLSYRGTAGRSAAKPPVRIEATFGGERHRWNGRIVRTEAEIDPRTRMVYAIAQVEDPYARGEDPDRPPLAVGMFVEAEIVGESVEDVIVLPRLALRGEDRVLVVDEDDRLRFRQIEILRLDGESAIVSGGLAAGERVCLSPLDAVADGMKVRVLDDADQSSDEPDRGPSEEVAS